MSTKIAMGITTEMKDALATVYPTIKTNAGRMRELFREGRNRWTPGDQIPRGSESCKGTLRDTTIGVTVQRGEYNRIKKEADAFDLDPDEYFKRVALDELRRRMQTTQEAPADDYDNASTEEIVATMERLQKILDKRDRETTLAEITKDLREYHEGYGYSLHDMKEALEQLIADEPEEE